MKKGLFVIFTLVTICSASAQKGDSVAKRITEKHLKVISDYLSNRQAVPTLERVESIAFLDALTDIPSSSPGNYIGQYTPSEDDLSLWKNWYLRNKNNIVWDEKSGTIRICKDIKPPKNGSE